jgi:putative transposase
VIRTASIAFGSWDWMRNALPHVPKGQQSVVAAALRQAFSQADQDAARQVWRQVADRLRPRWPRLAAFMDESEHDVLAYTGFPAQHRAKLHSTNPLERLNKMGYPGRLARGGPVATPA